MFKRFFDTEKWDKPWFRKLSPIEKCAWDFMLSRCDNVGVWVPDYETAEFFIGVPVKWDLFLEKCSDQITVLDNGKIWFHDFCNFQYGPLSEACKPHQSYIKMLKHHGIYDFVGSSDSVTTKNSIRGRVTASIRVNIYNRDRGECQYCGAKVATDNFVVDHFIPIAKGGDSGVKNLVLSCKKCNALKSDFLPTEFVERHPSFFDSIVRVTDFLNTLLTDSYTLQDKDKEKDKDKDKEKEQEAHEEADKLALLLYTLHLQIDSGYKVSDQRLCSWAKDIDKLNRIDGRDWKLIEEVLRWAKGNDFWKSNIMSGGTFRDKFPKLLAKMPKQVYTEPKLSLPIVEVSKEFEEMMERNGQ